MPVDLTTLSALNDADVSSNAQFLASLLSELFPSMNLAPGSVFYENLIRPASFLYTLDQTNNTRRMLSQSLLALEANPELADVTSVNQILSNYRLTRQAGSVSSGQIAVILSRSVYTPISTAVTFTSGGLVYRAATAFNGVPSAADATGSSDRVITPLTNGNFSFLIDVVSADAAVAANISGGTVFDVSPVPSFLVTAVAAGDFTGGRDIQSNTAFLNTLLSGITAQVVSGRLSIKALISTRFPGVVDVSLIGAGDDEMLRDSHTILSGKTGGKSDIYVRSAVRPGRVSATKSATLQDPVTGTWRMSFTRDEYPGMYAVDRVLPVTSADLLGSLQITSDTRGLDTSAITNTIQTPALAGAEGVYSRYQTVAITFLDPSTPVNTAGGTVQDYQVTVVTMPDLAGIHDFLTARAQADPGGDYLVKAPIPCFVAVTLKIVVGVGDPTPDAVAIQTAVAQAVNAVDFASGSLPSSVIIDAAQSLLTGRSRVVAPLDLRGRIRFPNGTSEWIFDPNNLTPPDRPDLMASSRTIAFYLDPGDVVVDLENASVRPV